MVPAGTNAGRIAAEKVHSLFIFDAGFSATGCFVQLAALRKATASPIIVCFPHNDSASYITALEMGADDCFSKPANSREMAARIRSLLRRVGAPDQPMFSADTALITVGDVEVDPFSRQAQIAGSVMELTSIEFSVLEILLRHAGNVVTRELLFREVFGREMSPFDRSLDVHISNLRKKLRCHSPVEYIKTIRSVGYQYVITRGGKTARMTD